MVERLHSELAAGLNHRIHLRDLVLANQVADSRRTHHDFVRRDAPAAVLKLQQRLRNHGNDRLRQHCANHFFFRRWEHVDHAVDRLSGRRRVQRAEHQVTGFSGGQRQPNRFQVAQLADQHHVRILTQCRPQRVGKRQGVRADLALVDHRLARLVHELDRIFNRQNVAV